MLHIAIIGVGGLGMRYVQSLARFRYEAKIQMVDISREALEKAEALFYSAGSGNHLVLESMESLDGLERCLDIAAIVTGSGPRRRLLEELLETKQVKNLLLEKVLFPQMDDYVAAERMIKDHGCKAWVNCGRRLFDFYNQLKAEFEGERITFLLRGGAWGIGCNGIHFLDLISFITGDMGGIRIYTEKLDDEIIESRRAGYIEFTGTLTGSMEGCDNFSITSDKAGDAPIIYTIASEKKLCMVNELAGRAAFLDAEGNWNSREILFSTRMQSEFTAPLFEEIIETGGCMLPDYQTSMRIHMPLLKELLNFMNLKNGTEEKICPIT